MHKESADFLTLMKSYLSQLMDMLLDQVTTLPTTL